MYLGNQPALSYTSFAKQDFTTSATTAYTLSQPVANENEIALFINFVRQEPTTAYTASGTSLTLTSATSASDDMYAIFLGKAVQTVNPPAGSVDSSKINYPLTTFSSTGIDDNATSTAITIDSSQNVGIGIASPASQLHLYSNDPKIIFDDNGTQSSIQGASGNILLSTSSVNRDIVFYGDTTEVARITGDAKVGINNASPSATLDVTGSIYASGRIAKNVQAWTTGTTSAYTLSNLVVDANYSTYLFTIIGTSSGSVVENKGLYFLTRTETGYSFATIQNSAGGTLSHSSGTLTWSSPTSVYRTWRASLIRLH